MRRIFLSFHHADEFEVTAFCRRYQKFFDEIRTLGISEEGEGYADRIESGDSDYVIRQIRERFIAGTTCTVVLIGKCTWSRRYIDWEVAATLRNNKNDPRGGLIAIQLGSAAESGFSKLPARLELNIVRENSTDVGYARFYATPQSDGALAEWVESAIDRSLSMEPAASSTADLRAKNSACE